LDYYFGKGDFRISCGALFGDLLREGALWEKGPYFRRKVLNPTNIYLILKEEI